MGLLDIVPAGVVTGDNLKKLFDYGKLRLLFMYLIEVQKETDCIYAL